MCKASSRKRDILAHFLVPVFVIALCALLAGGCTRKQSGAGASITIAGSTSVQPFAEMLAEEYAKEYPDRPAVNVQGGGSSAGASAALTGAAQLGMMSRELAESEKELTPIVIAHDAIALVVHPSNPVQGLTKDQVRRIFSGEVADWSQVGGGNGRINVVTREEGSGTRGAFDELVMKKTGVFPRAVVQDSNGAVRETVAGDKAGIGYVSLGLVDERVKALLVDGVAATIENARVGTYTLVRPFLFVHKGEMDEGAEAFVQFVIGEEGRRILSAEGLVTAE